MPYLSGEEEKLHFAAYRLKYSRWVHVEIVRNATFAQMAVDYGFIIELCEPSRANQKGSVENLVGWVKGSFFKVRRFQERDDLLAQLAAWLDEVNERRPSRATGIVPAVRLVEEQTRLRPLVLGPEDYGLRFEAFVGPTAVVTYGGIRYAMPAESIGFSATLYLYADRIRIVAGRHERTHPRFPAGDLSYPPDLRAQHLASVSGMRGRLYFQRQRLLDLGAESGAAPWTHRGRVRRRTRVPGGERMSLQAAVDLDVDAMLRRLHLPTIRRLYAELEGRAEQEELGYRDYLGILLAEEIAHRAQTRVQRSVRKAKFPFVAPIEDFDFTFQSSVKLHLLGSFLGPELVTEGRNLILSGPTGTVT